MVANLCDHLPNLVKLNIERIHVSFKYFNSMSNKTIGQLTSLYINRGFIDIKNNLKDFVKKTVNMKRIQLYGVTVEGNHIVEGNLKINNLHVLDENFQLERNRNRNIIILCYVI